MTPCQPASREYRTWIVDSRRWDGYWPRGGDIVIATYPKCGTTWMQRIVSLLVFADPAPRPVMEISPWIEKRFPEPAEAVMARLEDQGHRRFVKSHIPFDGLPIFDHVKYIHVGRDGRDAAMSFHNHARGFSETMLAGLDQSGLTDETIARSYPRMPEDPSVAFHSWLTKGAIAGHDDGFPSPPFFHFVRSWWRERERANVHLVHFNDLKRDLAGEMHRVAEFLEITITPALWPALVEAAGFAAMRADGSALLGRVAAAFQGGGDRFFHKGTNGRWRDVYRDEDLARYAAKAADLDSDCATWLADGRRGLAS